MLKRACPYRNYAVINCSFRWDENVGFVSNSDACDRVSPQGLERGCECVFRIGRNLLDVSPTVDECPIY